VASAVRSTLAGMPSVLVTGAGHIEGMKKFIAVSQRMAVPPAKVVAVVEQALTAQKPKARYVVGLGTKLQVAFMRNAPAAVRDRMVARIFGVPRRA
jgi:hypothetical protein